MKPQNSIVLMGIMVTLLVFRLETYAQNVSISDEDLTKYANTMIGIEPLKMALKSEINDLVKSNELMEKGRVYKALEATKGDEEKISALGYSEEVLAAYSGIVEKRDDLKNEFKSNTTSAIKSNMKISTYNKVKKALKTDEDIKSRYSQIFSSLTM